MKNKLIGCLGLLILLCSFQVFSEAEEITVTEYSHQNERYPPVLFSTNLKADEFEAELTSFNAFSTIDLESVGLPIGVRVIQGVRSKEKAGSYASKLLSATTLFLTPYVSKREYFTRYDLFVQGKSIADFTYITDATDVEHMLSFEKNEAKHKEQAAAFSKTTIPQFLTDLKTNAEAQAVFEEYKRYFGSGPDN